MKTHLYCLALYLEYSESANVLAIPTCRCVKYTHTKSHRHSRNASTSRGNYSLVHSHLTVCFWDCLDKLACTHTPAHMYTQMHLLNTDGVLLDTVVLVFFTY